MMAFCKYRTPPWISLVLRLLVPEEKSLRSTRAVFRSKEDENSTGALDSVNLEEQTCWSLTKRYWLKGEMATFKCDHIIC